MRKREWQKERKEEEVLFMDKPAEQQHLSALIAFQSKVSRARGKKQKPCQQLEFAKGKPIRKCKEKFENMKICSEKNENGITIWRVKDFSCGPRHMWHAPCRALSEHDFYWETSLERKALASIRKKPKNQKSFLRFCAAKRVMQKYATNIAAVLHVDSSLDSGGKSKSVAGIEKKTKRKRNEEKRKTRENSNAAAAVKACGIKVENFRCLHVWTRQLAAV